MKRQLRLMPAAAARRQAVAESLAVWCRALAACVVIGASAVGVEVWRGRLVHQQRNALEAQYAPVQQLKADVQALRRKIARMNDTQRVALELADDRSMVTLLGAVGRSAAYADGELFVESLSFLRRHATDSDEAEQTLSLEGVARDNVSVTRFVESLRHANMFGSVRLTSTGARTLSSQSMTAFSLECVF